MDENEKQASGRRLAEAIAARIEQLRAGGANPARIADELRQLGIEAGVPIRCVMREVLPGMNMLEVKIGEVAADAKPDVVGMTKKPCPWQHYSCPACKDEICFMAPRPPSPRGCCPHCTSFLVCSGEPLTVRLMTDQETIDLPDSERIELQRARRWLQDRKGRPC